MTGRQRAAGQQQDAWPIGKPGRARSRCSPFKLGWKEADARVQSNAEARTHGRRVQVMRDGSGPSRVEAQLNDGRQQGRGAVRACGDYEAASRVLIKGEGRVRGSARPAPPHGQPPGGGEGGTRREGAGGARRAPVSG